MNEPCITTNQQHCLTQAVSTPTAQTTRTRAEQQQLIESWLQLGNFRKKEAS